MSTRVIALLFFIINQICWAQVDEQTLKFDYLSIKNGLSHNTIFSLLQDRYGYIWIGTQNGLNRYDGYTCKLYSLDELIATNQNYSGEQVSALFEDKKGNLWVGTKNSGIRIKRVSSDRFVRLSYDSLSIPFENSEISSFYEDDIGHIWITTIGSGLIKYDVSQQSITVFNTLNSKISSDVVFDIVKDKNGMIWVATAGSGLNCLKEDGQFEISHKMLYNSPNMVGFRKKILLDDNFLWVGTEGSGLYKMNIKNRNYIHFSSNHGTNRINSEAVIDLFKSDDNKIYIATDGEGLNVYDIETNKMYSYTQKTNSFASLNSNSLRCFLGDRTGNIWIGTFNGGVNIYKPSKVRFDYYLPKSINESLPARSILSVLQTQSGQTLVGTDGSGLYEFSNQKFNSKPFIHNSENKESIGGNKVKTLFQDSQGNIWLGFFAGGLDLYDIKSKTFSHFMDWNSNWKPNVWSITELKNTQELLIATLGDGLYTLNINSKKLKRYSPQSNKLNSFLDFNITTVHEDKSGRIWIGSLDNGLDLIDESNQVYKHFKNISEDSFSLSHNAIQTIYEDSDGEIWIGTDGGGINRWIGNDKFERINQTSGLIDNHVMSMIEDKNNNLWISTFQGVSRFTKNDRDFLNFNSRLFQNTNQFNQNSISIDNHGKLFFGGIYGLHSLEPKQLTDRISKNKTQLIFSDLKVFGKSIPVGILESNRQILEKPIENSNDIWLNYDDKSFTIYFKAIDYLNPTGDYLFKMQGFNDNWRTITAGDPSVTYTNLDPGHYVFNVKYNEKISFIQIHIAPPYWQTLWFKLLIFIFGLGLISFLMLFWVKRREASAKRIILQLQNDKLATEVESKNSKLVFSSAQMAHKNELLIELKQNLIDYEKKPDGNLKSLFRKLDYELKNENYWNEFNLYFNELDHKFLDLITKAHPSITKNDLRLCSLIRMNLSSKEIASLLNISLRAVEQGRYRLKKRFGIDKSLDLAVYIKSFNSI